MSPGNTHTHTLPSGKGTAELHLCHGQRPLLGERVVVEVQDPQLPVVPHGRGQGHHACRVDPVLGQVDLLQAGYELIANTRITGRSKTGGG